MGHSDKPTRSDLDRYIGNKVKWVRRDRKVLPEIIALKLGLDMASYRLSEQGKRRFSSSEIYDLSLILSVRIEDLFPEVKVEEVRKLDPKESAPDQVELYEITHYFSGITDPGVRASILKSVKLASSFED